jgi:quercetin dioxygenase-like cupin family protein
MHRRVAALPLGAGASHIGAGFAEAHPPEEEVMMRPSLTRFLGRFTARVTSLAATAALLGIAAPGVAGAQAKASVDMHAGKRGGSTDAAIKWGPAPAVFPRGARMAVVSGDPTASGPFVVRLAMPKHYRIAPHFHPTDEHITVRSGALLVGMGDKLALKGTKLLEHGDTITAPATMHHFAATRGKTVIEVAGQGPFQLTYVNPADAPKP